MTQPIWFVSDVHLRLDDRPYLELFLGFLERARREARELWIVGDLFEFWIGDRQADLAFYRPLFEALRRLVDEGVRVKVVHGNRDFLIGGAFVRAGCELMPDESVLELGSQRVHVSHGDRFCIRDRSYQRARVVMRSRPVRALAQAMPGSLGHWLARSYRGISERKKARKKIFTGDRFHTVEEGIRLEIERADHDVVLCGHIHDLADRTIEVGGRSRRILTTGAWEEDGPNWVSFDAEGLRLRGERGGAAPLASESVLGHPGAIPGDGGQRDVAHGSASGARSSLPIVVTIDGPAGAGKSSVARALAQRLGFRFLDTGAMYRAVTLRVLRHGALGDDDAVARIAREADVAFGEDDRPLLDGEDVGVEIRSPEVTAAVSEVSAVPAVRDAMVAAQRAVAARGDLVCEGRDMGTVVFPDAQVRIYLDASARVRAERRHRELAEKGAAPALDGLLADIERRDHADSTRAVAPLVRAPGQIYVDSSDLGRDEVLDELLRITRERIGT